MVPPRRKPTTITESTSSPIDTASSQESTKENMPPRKNAARGKKDDAKSTATTTRKAATTKVTKTVKTTTKVTAVPKKSAAPKKTAAPVQKSASKKRGREESAEPPANEKQPAKKAKGEDEATAKSHKIKQEKVLPKINEVPSEIVTIFTFGTGENGDLGLGPQPNAKEVKRPRVNPHLSPDQVGVTALALGGMHGLALTKEGKVLTWGVNDMGALGRDTSGGEKTREINPDDSDSDDDEVEGSMNEAESTPTYIEFPDDVVIARIAAGDSISIAVTDTGRVYGWGTFRASDGLLGFSEKGGDVVQRPTLLPDLHNIVDVSCGNDHVLALDNKGVIFAWGNGQQNQLGRRVTERHRLAALRPHPVTLKRKSNKAVKIFTGHYHSFAIDQDGKAWAWGLNGFAQTGIYQIGGSSETTQTVASPMIIDELADKDIIHLAAGVHHSLAISKSGEIFTWGRMDAKQCGTTSALKRAAEGDIVTDSLGKDRMLIRPTIISDVKFRTAECGTDHTVAIDQNGDAWSWGFGSMYQVGQGPEGEDIEIPTRIINTATSDFEMKIVACGGNFSSLGGVKKVVASSSNSE